MAKVDGWLEDIGLGQYVELFAQNHIDLDVLPDLSEADLAQLGITLGDRKRLMRAIARLAAAHAPARAEPPAKPATTAPSGREGERRQLTVMFCDMVGSTALSARMDPEDLREVIRRYQETCAEVIGRFDGYIGHYVGDGILVYFGFPRAHEDDPRRAVQAGLEIVEKVQALNAEFAAPEIDIAVRVGINTGLVVAGDIGTGEFRDEMAVVGETPNVAARLQGLAEPGTVLVGQSTHRLVEGLFVFDELGPHTIKGIDVPIAVYRVREASGVRSRFEATAIRGLTPAGRPRRGAQAAAVALDRRQGGRRPGGAAHRRARDRQVAHHPGFSRARARRRPHGAALLLLAVLRAQRPASDPRSAGARRAAEEERFARGQAGQAGSAA